MTSARTLYASIFALEDASIFSILYTLMLLTRLLISPTRHAIFGDLLTPAFRRHDWLDLVASMPSRIMAITTLWPNTGYRLMLCAPSQRATTPSNNGLGHSRLSPAPFIFRHPATIHVARRGGLTEAQGPSEPARAYACS
jgi:hypothetical protein